MSIVQTFKKNILNIIVFLTGASILIIEITATRILSPYFGNTTYTVTGVISIILLALSIGYYYGGRLADKHPSKKIFFQIILAGGVTTVFIQLLAVTITPIISPRLPMSTGPLIMATLLFCIPGILLGMLSPFAIKLQSLAHQERGLGENAGTLFFFSTLGSILGSISTAFLLIPNFGISYIVVGTGIFLIFLGVIGLIFTDNLHSKTKYITFLVLLISAFSLQTTNQSLLLNTVYFKDGTYEKIAIIDTQENDKTLRLLTLDHNSSSGKYLNSNELAFQYTKYYELYKIRTPTPDRVVVLGAGGYSIPARLHHELPHAAIESVDIEPLLPSLAQEYFDVPNSPNIIRITNDARRHLHQSTHSYSLIFSDAFSSKHVPPAHLGTKEFYKLVSNKLNHDGIFIANFHGTLEGEKSALIHSSITTIKSIFPSVYVFQVGNNNKDKISNIIIAAYKDDFKITSESITTISNKSSDSILPDILKSSYTQYHDTVSSLPILTDNYAPLEYLESKLY